MPNPTPLYLLINVEVPRPRHGTYRKLCRLFQKVEEPSEKGQIQRHKEREAHNEWLERDLDRIYVTPRFIVKNNRFPSNRDSR